MLAREAHVGKVRLRVSDLDRSADFYGAPFGLSVLDREDGLVRMTADGERPLVELDARESAGGPPAPRGATGLFHIALLYSGRAALGRTLERLLRDRVRLTGASDHLVSEAIYLDDPDGNGIEVYRDRPREDWDEAGDGQVAMASLPLDLEPILARAGDAGPEEDARTVVGHVHLKVSDLDRSVEFYSGTLGLELRARLGPQAAFLAAGGYHHHVGLNVWHSRGGAPPPPGSAGLAFFTLVQPAQTPHRELRDPDGIEIRLEAG